jgi:hypothetical protein
MKKDTTLIKAQDIGPLHHYSEDVLMDGHHIILHSPLLSKQGHVIDSRSDHPLALLSHLAEKDWVTKDMLAEVIEIFNDARVD